MSNSAPGNRPKRPKWLNALAVVIVLYTIIGFFVVPAIIKSQLLQRLPALTKRQVAIGSVKCNPYVLSLTIDDLSLKETNGEVFSSFGELYVNFQLSSIFKGAWVFDEVSLSAPFAQVIYFKDGTFNFANLLSAAAPTTAPQKSQPIPPVIVYHLRITNGAVAFTDMTRKSAFSTRYEPINVNFSDFTTLRDQSSTHEITATGDSGESIAWTGDITVNPLRAHGSLQARGLKLPKYRPYSQDYARFEIADGSVDAGADYSYDSSTSALDLNVSNAFVTLNHLEVKTLEPAEDVLVIPSLAIKQAEASLANHTAKIGAITSSGGSIVVRQSKDGKINLLSNLIPQPAAAPSTNTSAPWTAAIDEIAFDHYAIKAEDEMPAKPANFDIDQLAFDLKNVSNRSNAPVSVALSLRLQGTGQIGVSGAATLLPPSAILAIGVTNLDLRMAQPYLDEQVKMAVTRGALTVNGRAQYAPAGPGAPLVSFAGDVSVRDFAVADEVMYENFATWDSLDITGINATLQPDKFQVAQIKFTHPVTTAVIEPDRRLNFLTILPEPKTNAVAATSPAPTNTMPVIVLDKFAFENAVLHFADRSIEPNCTFEVQDSSGSVQGISSLSQTPAVVDVHGRVDQFSTYSVSGNLNPLPDKLFADVSVAFTNTGLTAFSPYTEVYAGRPLEKGKLSLALHYQINQKDLKAQNNIFIDQLTLGPKNGSTNATHLPVKLAIALLKDRNGRILLDVPVNGRLDDPKFNVWPIIRGVVYNLIVKAATAPFSLLGAMFGGGEELSFVAFNPGQADIPAAETNKLNTLVKALYERPELSMEINGTVDPAADRDVMAQAKFDREIKTLYIKEMTNGGKSAVAVEQITLAPADYARLVPEAYSNSFGPFHPASTNQTPGAAAAPLPKTTTATAPIATHLVQQGISPYAHGAPRMVYSEHPHEVIAAIAPRTFLPIKPPTAALPVSVAQSDLDSMEQQLLQKITITSDDYRQLMQDRASQVEGYLLKSGQVTADRLFITAPKPIQPNSTGQDRANLTLD